MVDYIKAHVYYLTWVSKNSQGLITTGARHIRAIDMSSCLMFCPEGAIQVKADIIVENYVKVNPNFLSKAVDKKYKGKFIYFE